MTIRAADDLDMTSIEQRLRGLGVRIGLPVHGTAETGSTNEDAMRAGEQGAVHGALFLADGQRAGRGRLGRTWYSPRGQNLYMSVLLRPAGDVRNLASITIVAGLAVAQAAQRFLPAGAVGIKWPNDVVVGSKKLAGILVEASTTQARVDHIVVGIGINVRQTEFDPAIAAIATSIAREAQVAPSRLDVLAAVVERLGAHLDTFERSGLGPMLEAVRGLDVLRGKTVRVNDVEGEADGIDESGCLRVQTASGAVVPIHAGEVKLVW
jgi:BirA family biotin operon repressor/biotin-[acetyl-CoA-carboxylase] ligase